MRSREQVWADWTARAVYSSALYLARVCFHLWALRLVALLVKSYSTARQAEVDNLVHDMRPRMLHLAGRDVPLPCPARAKWPAGGLPRAKRQLGCLQPPGHGQADRQVQRYQQAAGDFRQGNCVADHGYL